MATATTIATTTAATPALSLAELEIYDPHASQGGRERRFCCPLPDCAGKAVSAAHRSLAVNTQTGAWHCHRCGNSGLLQEFRSERPALNRAQRTRAQLSRAFALSPTPLSPTEAGPNTTISAPKTTAKTTLKTTAPNDGKAGADNWRRNLRGLQKLAGTPGEEYLESRGIPLAVAEAGGVRYAPQWQWQAAVVFPIRDAAGTLVAAHGRHIVGEGKITFGDKKQGAFFATARFDESRVFTAFDQKLTTVILTEAPLDALSLAALGYPALALCGTSWPAWLHRPCAFRRVLIGLDADEAGDKAAGILTALLRNYGARVERLRPKGAKDWNELLTGRGDAALQDWLAARVLLDEATRAEIESWADEDIFD